MAKKRKETPPSRNREPYAALVSPTAGSKRTYTMDSLIALLGPVNESQRTALFEKATEKALVKRGTRVESSNILQDAPLFLGSTYDIWQSISQAQRMKVNIDPQIFALCLDEAVALRRLYQGFQVVVATAAGDKIERTVEGRQEKAEGMALRRSIMDSLKSALDDAQGAHVKRLAGTARTPETLALSMEQIADYVTGLLATNAENERLRLSTFNITADRAAELKSKATLVRAAGTVTVATIRRVEQRKLDLQDGRVLLLIEHILRAFRAARREDSTILLPELRMLARMFDTRSGTARSKPRTLPPPETGNTCDPGDTMKDEGGATEPPMPPGGARKTQRVQKPSAPRTKKAKK